MWIIARGDESLILWWRIEYLEICLEHKFSTPGKRCEKNYSSVRRYVADLVNAYPKQSITKLIPKGAVKIDVVSYQFRCALNYSKLMEPVLGMRYNDPEQLKLALCNYGVAHGYQLWFMKNDWKSLLMFRGKDIQEGRCAGKKGNKNRV
ncbi:hypothetical protein Tco_0509684 [Tanacetum coccineum]